MTAREEAGADPDEGADIIDPAVREGTLAAKLRWLAGQSVIVGSPGARHVLAYLARETEALEAENEQLSDLDAAASRRKELQGERDRAVARWHEEHKRAETAAAERERLDADLEEERRLIDGERRAYQALAGAAAWVLEATGADLPTRVEQAISMLRGPLHPELHTTWPEDWAAHRAKRDAARADG